MTDAELQRLERCKTCFNSTEADNFQGGIELYCPLHGCPCDMIIQCEYDLDNNIRNLTDEEWELQDTMDALSNEICSCLEIPKWRAESAVKAAIMAYDAYIQKKLKEEK